MGVINGGHITTRASEIDAFIGASFVYNSVRVWGVAEKANDTDMIHGTVFSLAINDTKRSNRNERTNRRDMLSN